MFSQSLVQLLMSKCKLRTSSLTTHMHTNVSSEVKEKNDTCNSQKTGCLQKVMHDIGERIIDVCACLDGKITTPSIRDESSNNSGKELVCAL